MNTQELLWKYAEGQCSSHEKAEVEKLLATDENLREEFHAMQEIQSALASLEAEQPSMRFTKNVMEALPPGFYSSISVEPLLPPIWKKIFWGAVAGVIAAAILIAKSTDPTGGNIPYFDKMADSLGLLNTLISPDIVVYAVFVFVAVAVLAVFDRFLAREKWQVS